MRTRWIPLPPALDGRGQPFEVAARLALDLEPADGAGEAELVEVGWPQRLDHAPDVLDRRLRLGPQLLDHRERRSVVHAQAAARQVDLQGDARQRRADAVVQVAPERAALLLARGHDALAGALQVGREPHGVHGLARVLGEVGEHAAVLRREPVFPRAQAEHELPQRGTVVRKRERDRRAVSVARARRRARAARPARTSIATYGRRSACATVSTTPGSTASGAAVTSRRRARRATAVAGSSRSP